MPAGLYYKYTIRSAKPQVVLDKASIIIAELGYAETTASSFVDYLSNKYYLSKSTIWYNLKKLKRAGLVDFAEKNEAYKPLSLTEKGKMSLRHQVAKNTLRAGISMLGLQNA